MLKLKKIIFSTFFVLSFFFFPISVLAFDFAGETGLKETGEKAGYEAGERANPDIIISAIINVVLSFVGVVFLVLMLYGGYLWMTARGNEEQVTKAKDLIETAIIGLIIVMSAYAISYFVMSALEAGTLE